jgi:hypothetical protein
MGAGDLFWITSTTAGIAAAGRTLAESGCPTTKPVAITEWGIASQLNIAVSAFNAETPAYRFTYIARLLAMAALHGVKLIVPFSYTATPPENSIAGDWTSDVDGCAAAMTDVHTKLSGQTIVAGGVDPQGGSVTVTLASGATYIW